MHIQINRLGNIHMFVCIIGPPTTPVPCVDKLDDCQSFGKQVCTEPKYAPWVLANCRYFCRQCTGKNSF